MGYHTDFVGKFICTPFLEPHHAAYLRQFNNTRRVKRDPLIVSSLEDPKRFAVNLPIGTDGEYFVGTNDLAVVNNPPSTQPGLWCQWVPNEDGTAIEWDGKYDWDGEKHEYVSWLNYIIDHFMVPWGYELNGIVGWFGENREDCGVIYCKNNKVDAVVDAYYNPGPGDKMSKKDVEYIEYALDYLVTNLNDEIVETLTNVPQDDDGFISASMELENKLIKLSEKIKIVLGSMCDDNNLKF